MEPAHSATAICQVCHARIRPTAEKCDQCGAVRHFGPTRVEAAACSLVGLVALPAISLLILSPSLWTLIFAAVGLVAGFLFSHNRFGGDRWLKP